MKQETHIIRGEFPDARKSAWLRAYVRAHGEHETANTIGVGRHAVVRFCGELAMYKANLNSVTAFVDAHQSTK